MLYLSDKKSYCCHVCNSLFTNDSHVIYVYVITYRPTKFHMPGGSGLLAFAIKPSRRAPGNFPSGGGGGWSWGYIWFMFDFEDYVIKIML
jgi:hypothetical protein